MVNLRTRSVTNVSVLPKRKYTKKIKINDVEHKSDKSIYDIYDNEEFFIGPELFNPCPYDDCFPNLSKFTKKKQKTNVEPIKAEYNFKHFFQTKPELDAYLKSVGKTVLMAGTRKVPCNNCKPCCDNQMLETYRKCKCGLDYCQLKFKINKCPSSNWLVSECGLNFHVFQHLNANVCSTKKGISNDVQSLIKQIVEDDKEVTPKKILIKIREGVKYKKEGYTQIAKTSIPTLKQVKP